MQITRLRGHCGMHCFFPGPRVVRASARPFGACSLFLEKRLSLCGMQILRELPRMLRASAPPCGACTLFLEERLSQCGMQIFPGPPRDPCERPSLWAMHPLPRGTTPPAWLDQLEERRAASARTRDSRFIAKPLWHSDFCRAPAQSARATPKVHGSKKTLA